MMPVGQFLWVILNNRFAFLLSAISLSTVSIASTNHSYVIIGLVMTMSIVKISANPRRVYFDHGWLPPALMLIAWVYGVALGFIYNNPVIYIFSNFAGMAVYSVYFLLRIDKIDGNKLYDFFNFLVIIYFVIAFPYFGTMKYSYLFDEIGIVAFRMYYSVGLVFCLIPISVVFFDFFSRLSNLSSTPLIKYDLKRVFAFLLSVVLIAISGSKGLFLAFGFIVTVAFLLNFRVSFRWLIFLLSIIFLIHPVFSDIFNYAVIVLNLELSDSSTRVIQAGYIISELTVSGSGLGSSLSSGYARDIAGYGFELTYHNIAHKLGVISIIVYAVLAYPLFFVLFAYRKKRPSIVIPIILGSMGYLIVGYGNPIIFAPLCVLLHVLALKLIANEKERYRRGQH